MSITPSKQTSVYRQVDAILKRKIYTVEDKYVNARVEARGTIVPKAVGRGYYGPERRHKGI